MKQEHTRFELSQVLFWVMLGVGLIWAFDAFAQTASQVQIATPEQVNQTIDMVVAAIVAGIMALLYRVAGPVGAILNIIRLDHTLEKFIKGKLDEFDDQYQFRKNGIRLDVKHHLIAEVANAVISVLPSWLIRWAGGADGIRQKVRNRLPDFLRDIPLLQGQTPSTPVVGVAQAPPQPRPAPPASPS